MCKERSTKEAGWFHSLVNASAVVWTASSYHRYIKDMEHYPPPNLKKREKKIVELDVEVL